MTQISGSKKSEKTGKSEKSEKSKITEKSKVTEKSETTEISERTNKLEISQKGNNSMKFLCTVWFDQIFQCLYEDVSAMGEWLAEEEDILQGERER